MRISMGRQPYDQKPARFTVRTTYGTYEIDADRHNCHGRDIFFWQGTWHEPIFDCNVADLLEIRRNF